MGFKTSLIALSAEVPAHNITSRTEGGKTVAENLLATIFPNRGFTHQGVSNLAEASHPGSETIGVSCYDDTVVLGGMWALDAGRDQIVAAAHGRQVWELEIHSVVDLCRFEVRDAKGQLVRRLIIDADTTTESFEEFAVGEPLPFEVPYWAGEHRDDFDDENPYLFPFHPLALGEAALGWIFGTYAEGAPTDAVQESLTLVDSFEIPMHEFVIGEHVPEQKKNLLGRLFGRG